MTQKPVIVELKKLPKPARETDLLRQQEEAQLKREIVQYCECKAPVFDESYRCSRCGRLGGGNA